MISATTTCIRSDCVLKSEAAASPACDDGDWAFFWHVLTAAGQRSCPSNVRPPAALIKHHYVNASFALCCPAQSSGPWQFVLLLPFCIVRGENTFEQKKNPPHFTTVTGEKRVGEKKPNSCGVNTQACCKRLETISDVVLPSAVQHWTVLHGHINVKSERSDPHLAFLSAKL